MTTSTVIPKRIPIYEELLNRALAEPFGLSIPTNNPKQLQIELCNLQRMLAQKDLLVCLPSTPNTVFLVKRSVELD